jgi:hypothetical protein
MCQLQLGLCCMLLLIKGGQFLAYRHSCGAASCHRNKAAYSSRLLSCAAAKQRLNVQQPVLGLTRCVPMCNQHMRATMTVCVESRKYILSMQCSTSHHHMKALQLAQCRTHAWVTQSCKAEGNGCDNTQPTSHSCPPPPTPPCLLAPQVRQCQSLQQRQKDGDALSAQEQEKLAKMPGW